MDYRDYLVKYGVFAGKRFRRKEKLRFISAIMQEFNELGYKTQAIADKEGKNQIVNIYAGDITQAKTIITTSYDTPLAKLGWGWPYQPFDLKARSKENFTAQMILLVILTLVGVPLVYYAGRHVFADEVFNYLDVMMIALLALFVFLSFKVSKGIGNRNNLNRYSATIVGMIDLAKQLSEKQRKQVAFAFTDMGTINNTGDFLLRNHLQANIAQKLMLVLDCLGRGSQLKVQGFQVSDTLLHRLAEHYHGKYELIFEEALADSKQLATIYPKTLALAVGELKGDQFQVAAVGTKADVDVDYEELAVVIKAIKKAYLD